MKLLKRIIILILGGTVLAIGVAMVVLPGPAFIVIPAGLAILAVEFVWARRLLNSARDALPRDKADIKSIWKNPRLWFRRVVQSLSAKGKVT